MCLFYCLLQDHNEPALDGISFDVVTYVDPPQNMQSKQEMFPSLNCALDLCASSTVPCSYCAMQDHNEPALDGISFDIVNYADLRSFQLQLNRQFINYRLPLRESRGVGPGEGLGQSIRQGLGGSEHAIRQVLGGSTQATRQGLGGSGFVAHQLQAAAEGVEGCGAR